MALPEGMLTTHNATDHDDVRRVEDLAPEGDDLEEAEDVGEGEAEDEEG